MSHVCVSIKELKVHSLDVESFLLFKKRLRNQLKNPKLSRNEVGLVGKQGDVIFNWHESCDN